MGKVEHTMQPREVGHEWWSVGGTRYTTIEALPGVGSIEVAHHPQAICGPIQQFFPYTLLLTWDGTEQFFQWHTATRDEAEEMLLAADADRVGTLACLNALAEVPFGSVEFHVGMEHLVAWLLSFARQGVPLTLTIAD